jgi:hypothetical protein
MASYIPAYKGYITDVPELWFKRNDGKVFHFDQLTAANMSPNVNFTEVNAGWSLYPVAYLPGQSTMEMQCTSGQFNADLFAMANGQTFKQKTFYVPFTKTFEVDSTKKVTLTHAGLIDNDDYKVTVEGMERVDSNTSIPAGSYHVSEVTSDACTLTIGDMKNDEGITSVEVTYYIQQNVKAIDIDNKSTAVGSLIAKWPVYSSGEEGNAGGVKGHLLMQVGKCRITAMPGFDTSYKSAATNSVTFSVMENRGDEAAYTIAYYELPKAE